MASCDPAIEDLRRRMEAESFEFSVIQEKRDRLRLEVDKIIDKPRNERKSEETREFGGLAAASGDALGLY